MCRLFGMSAGPAPAKATFWLLDAPDSLSVQSHREPDGTGLGWLDEQGRPHVSKRPIAAYEDREFARRAQEVTSRTFVAHVRFASTGALEMKNTHPFEQSGRLFAHNGVIEDLQALEQHLGADGMALVKGDTDSERLFALITRETAAHDGDLAAGITTACRWVAANLPLFAINLVLITDQELWALRYPETHELFVLEREPGRALELSSRFGTRVSSEHGLTWPSVTLASEMLDAEPGWRALRSGELLRVSPTLEVTRRRILDGPPAHALTLADLGQRARSSQAKPAT
ncbi:MAG: class II glutamine amidotransferase [Solirubrobacteraceae bacterium]